MGTFSYKVTNIKRFMTRLLAAGQTKKYIVRNVCSSWLQTKQPCLSALLWFQNCKLCSWRNLDTRVIAEFASVFTWNSLQLECVWEWSFSYHMCFSSLCLHVWEQSGPNIVREHDLSHAFFYIFLWHIPSFFYPITWGSDCKLLNSSFISRIDTTLKSCSS